MPVNIASGPAIAAVRRDIEQSLRNYLPPREQLPVPLWDAMTHALLSGGKRLRPLLVYAAWEATGGAPTEDLWRTCAAAEYLHTFSLVHDDLPCMDDDDLRRGQPTCHKQFGEGVAVLAGDALAVLAFEVLATTACPALVREFAQAIGSQGMIGGQVADMQAEGKPASRETVALIHRLKTAALMRACTRAGGLLSGAGSDALAALSTYGECLGLAFQIKDDLLDVEGSTERLGKTAGSDLRRAKATYPAATSKAEARRQCEAHAARALSSLAVLGEARLLRELVRLCTEREA
jgi:geranylgeranyl diphosphate synthase type II